MLNLQTKSIFHFPPCPSALMDTAAQGAQSGRL